MGRCRGKTRSLIGTPGASPFAESLADYAHNLLVGTALRRLDAAALKRIGSCEAIVDLAGSAGRTPAVDPWEEDTASAAKLRAGLRTYLRAAGRAPRTPRPPASPVAENLERIDRALGLDAAECELLRFLVALHGNARLKEAVHMFGDRRTRAHRAGDPLGRAAYGPRRRQLAAARAHRHRQDGIRRTRGA